MGKWSPNEGYGSLKNDLLEDYPPSRVKVLKIHGSTTFVSAPYLDKPKYNAISFEFDEKYFPKSAKHTHMKFGSDKGKPYFILPSYVKIPSVEIVRLMLDSLKEVSQADKLIIIGCSLRPEDSFLTLLLTHYIREKKTKPHIIILDLNADNISSRICDYWGTNIKEHIISINDNIEEDSINVLCSEINKQNSKYLHI